MLPELLEKANLFHLLHQIDLDLAEQTRKLGCPFCGSALHYSNYERKPRGGPDKIPERYLIRQSLCCSARDCRRRTLPGSCLFMGRRVYWGCVILVVMALRQQRAGAVSIGKLKRMFDISHKTIRRWILYYKELFPSSAQWQALRGAVSPAVDNNRLPGSLLEYFMVQFSSAKQGLIACLRFLATWQYSPCLTGNTAPAKDGEFSF